MTLLERRTVSRKTPVDGKLEVGRETADRLRARGAALEVEWGGRRAPALVETIPCGCAKAGAGGAHEHHFVASELLKELRAGSEVELRLDEPAVPGSAARVAVSEAG